MSRRFLGNYKSFPLYFCLYYCLFLRLFSKFCETYNRLLVFLLATSSGDKSVETNKTTLQICEGL